MLFATIYLPGSVPNGRRSGFLVYAFSRSAVISRNASPRKRKRRCFRATCGARAAKLRYFHCLLEVFFCVHYAFTARSPCIYRVLISRFLCVCRAFSVFSQRGSRAFTLRLLRIFCVVAARWLCACCVFSAFLRRFFGAFTARLLYVNCVFPRVYCVGLCAFFCFLRVFFIFFCATPLI